MTIKKVIAVMLAMCLFVPMTSLIAFANDDQMTTSPAMMTVYVRSDGNDNTKDGTNTDTPYRTFEAAYNGAIDSADGDVRIVILDSVLALDKNSDTNETSDHTWFTLSKYVKGTVYVCGKRQDNGSYPSIDFKNHQQKAACIITLGADTVFYDVEFKNSNSKNIWISAALYDLTLGFNISRSEECGVINITGSYWSKVDAPNQDTRKNGAEISIYSGVYNDVYAGHRNGDKTDCEAISASDVITLNAYGGTFNKIFGNADSTAAHTESYVTVNIYGGVTVNSSITNYSGGGDAYLNWYNGFTSEVLHTENFESVTKVELQKNIPAPQYAVAYCGVQSSVVENDKYSVRFVGTVDSLYFSEVGFAITAKTTDKENNFTKECKKVYSSVVGTVNDEEYTYTAAELGGNYIFAMAIRDIPTSEGVVDFKVTPFITVGEEDNAVSYYGESQSVRYTAGEHTELVRTSIKIASINLRNNDSNTTNEALYLANRMPRIINFINTVKPDSFGVQECEAGMRATLISGISSYYACAQNEQVTDTEDYAFKNFIWYNSNTTTLVKSGQFWLSDTPDEASKGYQDENYISAGWAVLKTQDAIYLHVNTHLYAGVKNGTIRQSQLTVLLEQIDKIKTANKVEDVFLTGDFNDGMNSTVYSTVTGTFDDTRIAADKASTLATFTSFGNNSLVYDYCFYAAKNVVNIDRFDVVEKFSSDGKSAADYMSDHNAVVVGVSIYTKKQNQN